MKIPKFKTTGFGLIDIGVGRSALSKYFSARDGLCAANRPIQVLIKAEISDQFGGDDGTSIEFEMRILDMKVKS